MFPNHPALTWQGGAQAVNKADLGPLAGRDVWIWPDNDQAGDAAARRLGDLLRQAGASSVKRVNLESLKQAPGRDGEGNAILIPGAALESGDDAADLVERGWSAAHVATLLKSGDLLDTTTPTESKKSRSGDPGKPPVSNVRFEMSEEGLFCNSQKGKHQRT